MVRGWKNLKESKINKKNLKEQSRENLLAVSGALRLEDRKMEECLKFHRHFLCDC